MSGLDVNLWGQAGLKVHPHPSMHQGMALSGRACMSYNTAQRHSSLGLHPGRAGSAVPSCWGGSLANANHAAHTALPLPTRQGTCTPTTLRAKSCALACAYRAISLHVVSEMAGWHKRGQQAHLRCPFDTLVSGAAGSAWSTLVRLAQNGVQLAARLGQQGLALLPAAGGSHAAAHGTCSRMSGSSPAALCGEGVRCAAPV